MSQAPRPKNFFVTTVVDLAEATVAFETVGQTAFGEMAIAAIEGNAEPYLTFTETLETAVGLDLIDAITVNLPDAQERNLHVIADIDNVDVGTGAVEDQDLVDAALYIDGVQVATSDEGPADALDLTGTPAEFTFDVVVQVDQGSIIQFALLSAGTADEEFTVTVEAAEAQAQISRA